MNRLKESYDTLGIDYSSNKDEINRAYRSLAKKYHPDINSSPDAEKQFIKITDAYKYIVNNNYAKYHSEYQNTSYDYDNYSNTNTDKSYKKSQEKDSLKELIVFIKNNVALCIGIAVLSIIILIDMFGLSIFLKITAGLCIGYGYYDKHKNDKK